MWSTWECKCALASGKGTGADCSLETSDANATPVPWPVQTHRSRCATSAPSRSSSCSQGRPLRCESPDRTKDTAQHLQPRDVAGLGRPQQALVQNDDQVRMDGGVRLRRHEDSLPATTLLGTDSAAVTNGVLRYLPVVVRGGEIGASGNQELHHVHVAVAHRKHQRSPPAAQSHSVQRRTVLRQRDMRAYPSSFSLASSSAPASMSISTVRVCPVFAANISAVHLHTRSVRIHKGFKTGLKRTWTQRLGF